ncbi:MAG: tetratricopeptide repeat protein [Thermoanaerobaculia bacterium]
MNARILLLSSALAFAPWPGRAALDLGYRFAAADGVARSETYRQARRALEEERWDEASDLFGRVVADGGGEAAAALYWQAYALNRAGRSVEALESARRVQTEYPESSWVDDARALELEIRPPDEREMREILRRDERRTRTEVRGETRGEEDRLDEETELKLYALNSLMNADPERAVPVLEQFLDGDQPIELKERALFVLANGGGREGRRVLRAVAAGERGAELQMKAIRFLGISGAAGEELLALYTGASDHDVKAALLEAMMVGGDRAELGRVVESETDLELKKRAIQMLAVSGGREEIRALYRRETDPELREKMLESTVVSGDRELLGEVLASSTDPDEQKKAIRLMGVAGGSSEDLLALYRRGPRADVKQATLDAMMVAGRRDGLLEIARSEQDPELRGHAVRMLAVAGGRREIRELYAAETDPARRRKLLETTVVSGDSALLEEALGKTTDPDEQETIIGLLGVTGGKSSGVLLDLYRGGPERRVKEKILGALMVAGDAESLVEIVRTETDRELKREALQKLSMVDSDEAERFFAEILER